MKRVLDDHLLIRFFEADPQEAGDAGSDFILS